MESRADPAASPQPHSRRPSAFASRRGRPVGTGAASPASPPAGRAHPRHRRHPHPRRQRCQCARCDPPRLFHPRRARRRARSPPTPWRAPVTGAPPARRGPTAATCGAPPPGGAPTTRRAALAVAAAGLLAAGAAGGPPPAAAYSSRTQNDLSNAAPTRYVPLAEWGGGVDTLGQAGSAAAVDRRGRGAAPRRPRAASTAGLGCRGRAVVGCGVPRRAARAGPLATDGQTRDCGLCAS